MSAESGIRNCIWKVRCDADWSGLSVTSNDRIRHCSKCNRDVHWIATEQNLVKAIYDDYCICIAPELAGTMDLFRDQRNEVGPMVGSMGENVPLFE